MAPQAVAEAPCRNPKEKLLESHKDEIHRTYMTDNQTLAQTMKIFESKYGLKASVRTWKAKLDDWNFVKYITKRTADNKYLEETSIGPYAPNLPLAKDKKESVPKRKRTSENMTSDTKRARLDHEPPYIVRPLTPPPSAPPSEPSPLLSARQTKSMTPDFAPIDPAAGFLSPSPEEMRFLRPTSSEEDLAIGIHNLHVTLQPASPISVLELDLDEDSASDFGVGALFEDSGRLEYTAIDSSDDTSSISETASATSELQSNTSRSKRRNLKRQETPEDLRSIASCHTENENWAAAEQAYLSAINKYIEREGRGSLTVYNIRSELVGMYNLADRKRDSISMSRIMIAEYEEELGRSSWMTLIASERLAQALASDNDFPASCTLFKKAIDGYGQHNHLSARLKCQYAAANVNRRAGRSKETLEFLHGALVTWLCFQSFEKLLGIEIIDSLQKIYKGPGEGSHWDRVSVLLHRLRSTLSNKITSSKVAESSDLGDLAEAYTSAGEFETADALFKHCLKRLEPRSETRSLDAAKLYFGYAKHKRRAGNDEASIASEYITLALQESLSIWGLTNEKKIINRTLLDEIRQELIENHTYDVPSILRKTLESENHISSFLKGEWLESEARLQRFYHRRMMKTALMMATVECERSVSGADNGKMKSSNGTTSTLSSCSIGVTYSENEFAGFDVAEVSKVQVKKRPDPPQMGSRPHYCWPL